MSQTPFSNEPDANDPAADFVPEPAADPGPDPEPEPEVEGEVDPITARNRRNARFSTGPRTEEGKATSSQNARTHKCCVPGLLPGELPEMLLIEQDLSDEIRPNGPTEQECVRMAAIAMVRSRRCDRQLAALHQRHAEATRELQRRPKALRVERLENSLELWSDALDRPVEFGEALGPMYPALLANLKLETQAEGQAGEVELFQGLHACALAIPRMMELHRRFGHLAELPADNGDAAEYSRRKGAQERSLAKLMKWIAGHLERLTLQLAEARRDLDDEDARPMDAADFIDESPAAKNLRRYRAEALREYRRHLSDLETYRTRNHREYERIVYREKHNIEPTCRFGPFLIWMPLWLRRLAPADQILSIIRELEADLPNNLRPTRDEAIRWHAERYRVNEQQFREDAEKSQARRRAAADAAGGDPAAQKPPEPDQPAS